MNVEQLRKLIRETILNESSFSVNSDVDRAFNSVGVYPPKMVNVGGSKYEGEIDKGWKLGYDETAGTIDVNGHSFGSLTDAAKFYKQNKGKPITMNAQFDLNVLTATKQQRHAFTTSIKDAITAAGGELEQTFRDEGVMHVPFSLNGGYYVTWCIDPQELTLQSGAPVVRSVQLESQWHGALEVCKSIDELERALSKL